MTSTNKSINFERVKKLYSLFCRCEAFASNSFSCLYDARLDIEEDCLRILFN